MQKLITQSIRLKQLNQDLRPEQALGSVQRPVGGWLRAVRQALGRSLQSIATPMKISPQAIHQFEKSEAAGTISLKQLEAVADAMGCRVVYTLLPRQGTLAGLADPHERTVRHTMSLEDQAVPPAE